MSIETGSGREFERSPEEKLALLEESVTSHLENRHLPIDRERWRRLIPSLTISNLEETVAETKEQYRLDRVLAHVDQAGNIEVDRENFFARPEHKQRHVLFHEPGHRLDQRFRGLKNPEHQEKYWEVMEIMNRLPADQVSLHVAQTAQRVEGHPEAEEMIRSEASAELIAQYLESDGSFKGMLEMKMAGNVDGAEPYWLEHEESRLAMEELGDFDELSEDDQLAFFDRHPEFADHFHIYANLREMFNDPEIMDAVFEDETWDDLDEIWEDQSLMATVPAPGRTAPMQPGQAEPKNEPLFDVLSLFKLF